MKILFIFSFLIYSISAVASLVTIQSEYPARDGVKVLKSKGSGFLVEFENKTFVITAAHVSQGANLEITQGNTSFSILGRLYSSKGDFEVLEVDNHQSTEAFKCDQSQCLMNQATPARTRWINSYNFVPLNQWVVDPNVDVDNQLLMNDSTPKLFLDAFYTALSGLAIVQPGTSGSPLVTVVPDLSSWNHSLSAYDFREGIRVADKGKKLLRGMAIRRERFFGYATFIPVSRILKEMKSYMNGERTPAYKEIEWKAKDLTLYRDMDQGGLIESASMSSAVAGGVLIDIGNGVSMDGGDTAKLNEDDPQVFLDKISAFPSLRGDPNIGWTLTMRHPTTSQFISYQAWFDFEYYVPIKRFVLAFSIKDSQNLNLLSYFLNRVGIDRSNPKLIFDKVSFDYKDDHLTISIEVSNQEQLIFSLNKLGHLCIGPGQCQNKFYPIIEVNSTRNESYIVDLRDFFFVDLSKDFMLPLRSPGLKITSNDEYYKIIYDEIASKYSKPRLFYRKKANSNKVLTSKESTFQTVP